MNEISNQPLNRTQGNRFSIFLLVLPIAAFVVMLAGDSFRFPLNQKSYLATAAIVALLSFVAMWWLSFRGVQMDKTLWGASAFTGALWMMAAVPFIGWLNQAGDQSSATTEYRRIVRKYYAVGGSTAIGRPSSSSCTVWLDTPLAGTDAITLRADYCGLIDGENDGLMLTVRQGHFNMPWLKDYSLIRQYDLYRQRLGVFESKGPGSNIFLS